MKHIPLHRHGIKASRLAIGCMGFGGSWDEAEPYTDMHVKQLESAVEAALSIGINFFDHADIYTRGKAERVFGELLSKQPALRDQLIIQSKCGIQLADGTWPGRYNFSREHILTSVDGILQRLGTDYVDILLLHRPDPLMDVDEVAEALSTLKASGKVKHFGVSNMHAAQLNYLRTATGHHFIVNQLHMSLAHHHFLAQDLIINRDEGAAVSFDPALMSYMQQEHIQVQAWGPLAQGRYSGVTRADATEAELLTSQYVAALADYKETSKEAIVLGWLMKLPAGIQPVLGTTNAERILACGDAERQAELMSREEWWTLYATASGTHKPDFDAIGK